MQPKSAQVPILTVVFAMVDTNACKTVPLDLTVRPKLFVLWVISAAVKVTNLVVFQNTRALLAIRKKQGRQLEQNS